MPLMTRRTLLTSALAAGAAASVARPSLAQDLVITPISPTSGSNTRYARFANLGPYGRPKQPIQVEPIPGLNLLCFIPPNVSEARPLVFSHGELSVPHVYEQLLGHWASHGFAVLAPLHDDSVIERGLRTRRQDPSTGGRWDLNTLINDADEWRARARLCRAVLDTLPTLERVLKVRMMPERPIIAGHSYGAYTAQMLLGARALAGADRVLEETEARFYGGILMSPQGRGIMGLVDGSWDTVQRPLLVATGNGDNDATQQDPNVRLEPYALSPPGNKHLAWFERISPTLYSGQQVRPNTPEQVVFQDLLAVTTAFLYAYGVYDEEVFTELCGDYYSRLSQRRVTMMYR